MTWRIHSTAGRHRGSLYKCLRWLGTHHGTRPRLLGPEGQKFELEHYPWCNAGDAPDWDWGTDITPELLAERLIRELEMQPHTAEEMR